MYLVCQSQKASRIWSCKFVDALQPESGITIRHGMGTRPQYSMVWEPDHSTAWYGDQTTVKLVCLGEEVSMFFSDTQTPPYLCHSLSFGLGMLQLLVGSLIVSKAPHPTVQ